MPWNGTLEGEPVLSSWRAVFWLLTLGGETTGALLSPPPLLDDRSRESLDDSISFRLVLVLLFCGDAAVAVAEGGCEGAAPPCDAAALLLSSPGSVLPVMVWFGESGQWNVQDGAAVQVMNCGEGCCLS